MLPVIRYKLILEQGVPQLRSMTLLPHDWRSGLGVISHGLSCHWSVDKLSSLPGFWFLKRSGKPSQPNQYVEVSYLMNAWKTQRPADCRELSYFCLTWLKGISTEYTFDISKPNDKASWRTSAHKHRNGSCAFAEIQSKACAICVDKDL